MGQLRSALRAYALEGRPPARVLQLLSALRRRRRRARAARRVVYAVIDPGAREVRYASAGHPPPLLVGADGRARASWRARAACRWTARSGTSTRTRSRRVPEGSTLVLYSDGAIERRGEPLDVGLERLAARGRDGARLAPEALCDALLDALIDGARALRDDVALLVGARARAGDRAAAAVVRGARRPARGRARGDADAGWRRRASSRATREIVVLAAGELCANAVEHAYPRGHATPPSRSRWRASPAAR